jgi:hypothetical protein
MMATENEDTSQPTATPGERHDRMLIGIDGVLAREDFLSALQALTDRLRNVQQFGGQPRHGERSPSDLTIAEDVLRALHFALSKPDADLLKLLHVPAVAALRATSGLSAIALETGAAVRMARGFGAQLVELVTAQESSPNADVAAQIASSPIWRDCPLTTVRPGSNMVGALRGLTVGHRILMPMLVRWVDEAWSTRRQGLDADTVDYVDIARALLRTLGVDAQDAANAVPRASR